MEPINVLSLFDGMSCGRIALDRADIPVRYYYASEIDKHAIKVSNSNYPNIVQIGDICNVKAEDAPVKIDLMLAGSPCQGFSQIGNQLNFDHPKSILYFEFLRLWRALKPTYWLLENVKMAKRWEDVISRDLGVFPFYINSKIVSAASRPRVYWTNLPKPLIVENNILAKSVIDCSNNIPNSEGWQKWWQKNKEYQLRKQYSCILNDVDKGVCQTARQMASWNGNMVRTESGLLRFASPLECERMQTVPEGYTNATSKSQAYKMLGNGWTVDVVAHILKGLRDAV